MSNAALPRNTTRQAEGMLYGEVARTLHRVSGAVIIVFVLVHVIVQAVRQAPMFASASAAAPWLQALQEQNWVHAILFFCIAFHTFHGLKLLACELGLRDSLPDRVLEHRQRERAVRFTRGAALCRHLIVSFTAARFA